MMRTAVYTLGCKLNQCESEALASSFESRGFFIVQPREKADIYIVNTCTVTSKAEQKARRMIRKLASENTESAVIVTGCYAQLDGASLGLNENVIVVPHDQKDLISRLPACLSGLDDGLNPVTAVREFLSKSRTPVDGPEGGAGHPERFWYDSVDFNYHSRAFLKIQDGCDNTCTYCRVTIARGDSVSLPVQQLLKQFDRLQQQGYREIVLTGVNISSYRSADPQTGRAVDFCDLLEILSAEAARTPDEQRARIRLSSIEPEAIDRRLADIVSSDIFCPHFHIPVQSGSDTILKLMKRRNDRSQIERAVRLLRKAKSDPFIAADIIAGFPGETEEDFEQSRSLLDVCDFTALHVFPFSPRPGTAAAEMPGQLPEKIRGNRTALLRALSRRNYQRYLQRWEGREVEVLIEEKTEKTVFGTSGNYLKCAACGILKKEGEICRVVVDKKACGGEDIPADLVLCRIIEGDYTGKSGDCPAFPIVNV